MTSSNRHWPSMFKSKPCNSPHHHHHHHQWQHDLTNPSPLLSAGCTHRSPYSTSGCDERSPDPKPRWNPKPEQIRILEAIFNSGMVNPPRDEIRKIRAQLQEYGQVGDANVFYWFQNRKSRSKHKLRHLHNSKQQTLPTAANSSVASTEKPAPPPPVAKGFDYTVNNKTGNLSLNSFSSPLTNTTLNLHQQSNFFQPSTENEFLTEPFMFPGGGSDGGGSGGGGGVVGSGGFGFSELTSVVHQQTVGSGSSSGSNSGGHQVGPCTNLLLNELMSGGGGGLVSGGGGAYSSKGDQQHHDFLDQKMKKILHPHLSYSTLTTTTSKPHSPITSSPTTVPFTVAPPAPNQIQVNSDECESGGGGGLTAVGGVPARSMVFINDVPFEVAVGPVNVREAFGEGAVLINSSGQPVLTNEWGVTLQSLQHGAFYYLI